jgi:hypothetical protein
MDEGYWRCDDIIEESIEKSDSTERAALVEETRPVTVALMIWVQATGLAISSMKYIS